MFGVITDEYMIKVGKLILSYLGKVIRLSNKKVQQHFIFKYFVDKFSKIV